MQYDQGANGRLVGLIAEGHGDYSVYVADRWVGRVYRQPSRRQALRAARALVQERLS